MIKSVFRRLWLMPTLVFLTVALNACVPGDAATESPDPGTTQATTEEATTEEAQTEPGIEADYLSELNEDSPLAGLPGYIDDFRRLRTAGQLDPGRTLR